MKESIIEYGTTLTKMAKKLLPTVDTQNLTQILEKQFIDGLQNRETTEKVMFKLYEKKSKNTLLRIDETIELARHVENAYITTRKFNNRNNAIDDISICMIDNKKQETESMCSNNTNNNTNNNIKEINLNNHNNFSNEHNTSTPIKQSQNLQHLQYQKAYNNGRQLDDNKQKSNNTFYRASSKQ